MDCFLKSTCDMGCFLKSTCDMGTPQLGDPISTQHLGNVLMYLSKHLISGISHQTHEWIVVGNNHLIETACMQDQADVSTTIGY